MHEPSDGIAEELERQLQLALAAAAVVARRAVAARERAIEQAQRHSERAAQTVKAQIEAERVLATERLRPVFDEAWWDAATPQDVADMWQEANTWRDDEHDADSPTVFDRAAHRIRHELRDRSGLDPIQVIALAAVQELEHEHQATLASSVSQPAEAGADEVVMATPRGFDDPQRREQLRARLAAAGVPEPAIEAGTLADLGQARDAIESVRTPVAAAPEPTPAAAHRVGRELRRQR